MGVLKALLNGGISYNLKTIGDATANEDKDRQLIAKTFLRIPKDVRLSVLDEVIFVFCMVKTIQIDAEIVRKEIINNRGVFDLKRISN